MLRSRCLPTLAALVAFAAPAVAHTGVGATHGFSAGVAHPLLGWDHLLAMLAVGLWAGLAGRRAFWVWPLCFLGFMTLGGLLGLSGIALPAMETTIAASVVALGLAVALNLRLPLALGGLAIAVFALAHGNAHGLEAPADAGGLSYALGFLGATALLHGVGLGLALGLQRLLASAWATRLAGLGVALAGVALASLG